jgi:hypothetical protein
MPRTDRERVYCVVCCTDGRWLLLNRQYKPFGQGWPRERWADYATCPGLRLWLTDKHLRAIDDGCTPYRPGDRMVWLYSDRTNPNTSAALATAYRRRLAFLDLEA